MLPCHDREALGLRFGEIEIAYAITSKRSMPIAHKYPIQINFTQKLSEFGLGTMDVFRKSRRFAQSIAQVSRVKVIVQSSHLKVVVCKNCSQLSSRNSQLDVPARPSSAELSEFCAEPGFRRLPLGIGLCLRS